MSVYKRSGAATYSYDFRFRGTRFSGATTLTAKGEAERYEQGLKHQLRERQKRLSIYGAMTFSDAWLRYWEEVGVRHRNNLDTLRSLEWLSKRIGATTPISDISTTILMRLVIERRDEGVSNTTVNRSVGNVMHALLRRAKTSWGQEVAQIDWRQILLKEPQERVREASPNEEALIIDAIRGDYAPPIRFALLTGCRRAEIVSLTWKRVYFYSREFRVVGKGDKARTIPMTDAVYDLLWSLRDHHPTAVFTFIAVRTRRVGGREWIRGVRYPITDEGFKTAWRRGPKGLDALADFRFHDTRHTAATRLVRATGNIRLAQQLLGHADIATTMRYAHIAVEDLRCGLEAVDATYRGR